MPDHCLGVHRGVERELFDRVGEGLWPFRCEVAVSREDGVRSRKVERAFPAGDDHCRHAVADQVGDGPRFRHEPVNPQQQCQTRHGHLARRLERGGQRNESAASNGRRALRRQQEHAENSKLVRQAQGNIGRLGDEDRRRCEIDRGSVEVERIPGRHNQPHDRLAAAHILQLGDHPRQGRLGRRCAEHDQNLFLDVSEKLPEAESGQAGDHAQHDEDEQETSHINAQHERAERHERSDPVLTDGKRHRAESPDRSESHDDRDHAEEHVRKAVEEIDQRSPFVAQAPERQAEQDRKHQNLKYLAAGERADGRIGDDVEQMVHDRHGLSVRSVDADLPRVERLNIGVDSRTRAHDIDNDQADHQRECRNQLEIDERFQADPADFLRVADLGDPDHHRGEDDRGDHHLDQLDEAVPERLHRRRRCRVEITERHADPNGGEHLKIQVRVKRLVSGRDLHEIS